MSTAALCDKSIPNAPCATRAPRILSFDYYTLDEALSPIRQVKTARRLLAANKKYEVADTNPG